MSDLNMTEFVTKRSRLRCNNDTLYFWRAGNSVKRRSPAQRYVEKTGS